MRKIKLFFVAAALCISAVLQAQNITVTGIVSDASTGEPIPFAALLVKGTKTGTSTDANGEYSITAPSPSRKGAYVCHDWQEAPRPRQHNPDPKA